MINLLIINPKLFLDYVILPQYYQFILCLVIYMFIQLIFTPFIIPSSKGHHFYFVVLLFVKITLIIRFLFFSNWILVYV